MAKFDVEVTEDTTVKIGDSNKSPNKIGIEVTADTAPAGTKVKVTVTVGCGQKVGDLLASRDDKLDVTRKRDDKNPTMNETGSTDPKECKRVFDTGAFPVSLPVSISLENFESNTREGDAEITVLVQTSTGRNEWSTGEPSTKKVPKELEPRDSPAIRYFNVDPDYVLHAGQTEVTVSFCATGYKTLTLYRNNQKVLTWPADPEDPSKPIYESSPTRGLPPGPLKKETPSITSVYRLVGRYKNTNGKEVRETLDRTVQVISSGWNQIALPQGSPMRLFVANDFKARASGEDRLYGIFKDGNDHHALYSSATGVDAWKREPGDVPQGMATSPGVYYKNRLWLIGGSSVEPDKVKNEVWCYEKDPKTGSRDWNHKNGKNDFAPGMEPRMGHACVVFKDAIWVIGGYKKGTAYRDVWQGIWQGNEDSGKLVWSQLQAECEWDGRLNPAATTWMSDEGCKVWIYGGSQAPQDSEPMRDYWSTTDGKTWQKEDETRHPSVPIIPDPGAPLASALVAFPPTESSRTDRLFLMGSFVEDNGPQSDKVDRLEKQLDKAKAERDASKGNRIFSYLFEWHPGTGLWEGRPVFDGWQQFQGQAFYLQAVVFNRFLICWSSLQDAPAFTGKLNVLVSQ